MGGGGGGSSNNSVTNQKNISNVGGDINWAGLFAFNYKSGDNDYRKSIESTARGEFTAVTDQRSQGGKGGDSSVGLGYSMPSSAGGTTGGLTDGLMGGGSPSGGSPSGGSPSGGGGGGMGSASNSGYSPTEMNGAGASLVQNKGVDSKWLIGAGIAVGLAFILSNRKK